MLAAPRRARYGYLLTRHVLRLCAAGRHPTEIAAYLLCSRASVYRIVRLYHAGTWGLSVDPHGQVTAPVRTTTLRPWLRRSLVALLKAAPHTYGWWRTRWRGTTLAVKFKTTHGMGVSAWTVRRWLHEMDWVWKRAKRFATDDDPQRIERLARLRFHAEQVQAHEVMVFADELDIHLWPKIGAAWRPKGSQLEVMIPGQNAKHDLAGALHLATSESFHGHSARQTKALFAGAS
jgi:transposase